MGIFEEHRSPKEVSPLKISRGLVACKGRFSWDVFSYGCLGVPEYLNSHSIQISYTLYSRPNIAGLKVHADI